MISFFPIKGQVYPHCAAQHPPEIPQLDADPKLWVICPYKAAWAGKMGTMSGFVVVFEQRWQSSARLQHLLVQSIPRASPGTPALQSHPGVEQDSRGSWAGAPGPGQVLPLGFLNPDKPAQLGIKQVVYPREEGGV